MAEPVSYGRRISELAVCVPQRTAVVHVDGEGRERLLTWGEVEHRANQAARLFAARGATAGGTVVVALRNTPEHVFSTLGAWKAGATVLPLRWDLPAWERERLLALAQPEVVVGAEADPPAAVVTLDDLAGSVDLDDSPPVDRVPDPARAIATSGSTGSPKLILALAPGVMSDVAGTAGMLGGLPPDIVQIVPSPLYHTNGFGCYDRLLAGARLVLMERFDAARFVDLVERWQVNHAVRCRPCCSASPGCGGRAA